MFAQNTLFFQRSKGIVEDFLQTTVIVDDQILFSDSAKKLDYVIPVDAIEEPGRKGRAASSKKPIGESDKVQSVVKDTGSHDLDAQKVINSFAEKRIVCSVIKPTTNDDWIASVEKLASAVDIIILDWDINKDYGESTKRLLGSILQSANQEPEQLRLLVVYTGENGIVGISEEIKAEMQKKLCVAAEQIIEEDKGFAMIFGSIRVVVFSKPGTKNLPKEDENRIIRFENLADRVTAEFARMTAGLVSNVAMTSLALIRKNTHKILNRFSVHLDAPYLTHRALQVTPEDAEEFLSELIAEEFRAILDEESVGKAANLDRIQEWLSASDKDNFVLPLKQSVLFSMDETTELLRTGIKHCTKEIGKSNPHRLPFTEMFKPGVITNIDLDERFSAVTTIRTYYKKKKPRLTFGTILKKIRDGSYWVCLQPRCDSIRIEADAERAFPVLPLKVVNADEIKKFRLVLQEAATYVRLSLKDKPYDLELIGFISRPEDHGTIVAKSAKEGYCFTSKKNVKYKWMGELRPEQAQRIVTEFAANLSRIGLDESEWQRLWATKG